MATKTSSKIILVLALCLLLGGLAWAAPTQHEPPVPAATQEDYGDIEAVGHLGGSGSAINLTDDAHYAFLGIGSGLHIFDISDPGQLRQTRALALRSGGLQDLARSGNTLYTASFHGLRIFDVTHPTQPAQLGAWDGEGIQGADVAGTTLYLAQGENGLRILDVSTPASPQVLGTFTTSGHIGDVQAAGDVAYVSCSADYKPCPDGSLIVVDIHDPAHPAQLAAYKTSDVVNGFQAVGDRLYLTVRDEGLHILDVSDPAHPALLGRYDSSGWAVSVLVKGTTAYLADGNKGTLILDVSDPAHPVKVGSYDERLSSELALAGSHLFVTGVETLHSLDVSQPAHPALLGEAQWPLWVEDVFIPRNAASASSADETPYGYVMSTGDLWVLDLTNPAAPVAVASVPLTKWEPMHVFVADGLAYVAQFYFGLEIFDVHDPLHPTAVALYDAGGDHCYDVFALDGYAYLTTSSGRLIILNMSDPAHPQKVGEFASPGVARRVFVADGKAYMADGNEGLRIVDVSNPAHPAELGHLDPPDGTGSATIFVEGTTAYLGSSSSFGPYGQSTPASINGSVNPLSNNGGGVWLQEIDVSDPAHPQVTGQFQQPDLNQIQDSYAEAGELYLAMRRSMGEIEVYVLNQHLTVAAKFHTHSAPTGPTSGIATYPTSAGVYVYPTGEHYGIDIILRAPPHPPGPSPTPSPSPTPTPACSVRGIVQPPKARTTCWVKPVLQQCKCGVDQVRFSASPRCDGWQFDHWAPAQVLQCPETGSATNEAWFVSLPTVRLKSQYEKYFLKNVSVKNCYTAIVEWNGPPGYVDFWMNKKHERKSSPPYQVCYDMGRDFDANLKGGRNLLKAVAVNGNGVKSDPALLKPMVFPQPGWLRLLMDGPWGAFPLGKYILYSIEIWYPSPPFEATVTFPGWLPWIGGKSLGVSQTQARVAVKAKSNGSGSGKLYGQTGFAVAGRKVAGTASGKGAVKLKPGKGLDLTQANFSLGIKGTIKSPKIGITTLIPALSAAEHWWFVGRLVRWVNSRVEAQATLFPMLNTTFVFKNIDDKLQFDRGEGSSSLKFVASFTVRILKNLKAALYGGGTPRITLQAPAAPSYLKDVSLRLFFGLKLIVWRWEYRFERGFKCWYPPGQCGTNAAQAMSALKEANWQLIPRDYVTEDYATFTANRAESRLRRSLAIPQTTSETEIVHGVFPLAEPALAIRNDGQKFLLWAHDDPAKPNGRGDEIMFTRWNGTRWSAPAGITNDNYEDFAPQVAFDANDHAVAVWERSNAVQPISPTLDITFTQSMEIAYSVWNGTRWSEPRLLTNDHLMDGAPHLARSRDGKIMALWRTNSGETLVGDEANPDSFYYAIWDGTAWSAPATALANLSGVLGVSLAYHGPDAAIVLSRDMDGDLSTLEDSELFYAEWDGAHWGALTRLTNNDVADAVPQIVYEAAGQVNLVWMQGDRLVFLSGGWTETPTPLWPEGGVAFANYTLTIDPGGNLALVYQELSESGADIYYTIYDKANGLWGLEDRLTEDLPLEDYLAPAFAADGTLWIAYTKVETLFEEKEVTIDGEQVTVEDVPVPGRSDLYLLHHALHPDMAIGAGDIALSVPNPAPGQTVVISATVHSAGDLAVAGGKVRFYDGDPGNGGVQIGETQLLTSPMRAGITDTVSVEWKVPATLTSHDLYVLLDPLAEVQESDESNNLAHVTAVLPDLLVGDLYADHVSPQTIRITTTVVNTGTIPAAGVRVEWHRTAVTGTLLSTAIVGDIGAGGSATAGFTWTVSSADAGEHLIYAVVDPEDTVVESDETNNTDSTAADVLPDLTISGSYLEVRDEDEYPSEPLTITLVLNNHGVAEARNVRVRVVQGDPFGETTPVLYETVIPTLGAGGTASLTANVSVSGWKDVYAIADPEWTIDEIDEGNNLALLIDFPPRIFLPLASSSR